VGCGKSRRGVYSLSILLSYTRCGGNMKEIRMSGVLCILILSTALSSAYAEEESKIKAETRTEAQCLPETFTGESKAVGNGAAYSWVTIDAKGNPSTVGMSLTECALSGLSENRITEFIVPLPKKLQPLLITT
jgi:hypothetical protein